MPNNASLRVFWLSPKRVLSPVYEIVIKTQIC